MRVSFVIRGLSISGGTRIIAERARMLHERGHTVAAVAGNAVASVTSGEGHVSGRISIARNIAIGVMLELQLRDEYLKLRTWTL